MKFAKRITNCLSIAPLPRYLSLLKISAAVKVFILAIELHHAFLLSSQLLYSCEHLPFASASYLFPPISPSRPPASSLFISPHTSSSFDLTTLSFTHSKPSFIQSRLLPSPKAQRSHGSSRRSVFLNPQSSSSYLLKSLVSTFAHRLAASYDFARHRLTADHSTCRA